MQSIAIKHIPVPVSLNTGLEIDFSREAVLGYKDAFAYYEPLASAGNAHAQYRCSVLFFKGEKNRFPQDIKKAISYLKQAADGNHPMALVVLGVFYTTGRYVAKDNEKALDYTYRAINLGNNSAFTNLGRFLFEGKIFDQDIKAALYYFHRAAGQGCATASYHLGKIYENGHPGIPKNLNLALKHYHDAADNEIESRPEASFKLAEMYYDGIYVDIDHNAAFYYAHRAANAGHEQARLFCEKPFRRTPFAAA